MINKTLRRIMGDIPRGFSLMEMVIALSIIGIFFTAAASVFFVVSKGFMGSRTRTVATNLAQEKIESLKNVSYSRLRVTSIQDIVNKGYDLTYYPPEMGLLVGDIPYERCVLVQRVRENSSGTLDEAPPDQGDTGLKKVTVKVTWRESGRDYTFSLSNMRDDPYRRPLDGIISGTITDADSPSTPLPETRVHIVDNLNWNTTTDTAGNYSIRVPTGTYQVKAVKDGYWQSVSNQINVGKTTVDCDLSLKKIPVASLSGYVFVNDRPVISEVVASTVNAQGENLEWIELYNPTTSQWVINTSGYTFYVGYGDENSTVYYLGPLWASAPYPHLTVATTVIEPNHYYLVANTPTVNLNGYVVNADAYYSGNLILKERRGAALFYIRPNDSSPWSIDVLGWAPSNNTAPYFEGEAIKDSNGLDAGKAHVRYSSPGAANRNLGSAFDSDTNAYNFLKNVDISGQYLPRNSSATFVASPVSGRPAYNATIACDDGVSSPVSAQMVDPAGYRLSQFTLPGVCTGTWNAAFFYDGRPYAVSLSAYAQVKNISVPDPNTTIYVTNANTDPAWPSSNLYHVILSSIADVGVVKGTVRNGWASVSGIRVEAGSSYAYTAPNGSYSLSLSPGLYSITANPNNLNSTFTSQSISTPIAQGQIISGVDFDISPGGAIAGRVLTNSGDYLPDVLVAAYDNAGNEKTSVLTGSDGAFLIKNLSVNGNSYIIKPILDSGEASLPLTRQVLVTSGQTKWTDSGGVFSSFTVTSAYGNITGSVVSAGEDIKTGVLIVATTGTITGTYPPVFDYSLLSGNITYYGTVSRSDGTYSLPVRSSAGYTVYAWYTTLNNGTPAVARKSQSGVTVNAATDSTVNFNWP